jgi:hypothetical protein
VILPATAQDGPVQQIAVSTLKAEDSAAEHGERHSDEQLIALDGKTYDIGPEMCVIRRPTSAKLASYLAMSPLTILHRVSMKPCVGTWQIFREFNRQNR